MDPSAVDANPGLQSVLVLLASSVLAVAACRSLRLPPMIGYLVTGLALGPHALGVVSEREETHRLAEFGVVFLMFSIGLEFSLTKLKSMRRLVFGLGAAQVIALAKAAAALFIVIVGGPRPMRAWLRAVARRRSNELFVLNVLLVTLAAAFITAAAGLSLVLGAFLAGMLISETEYRFQVEHDIKPFRDVLLGLFFITVGMMLDPSLVIRQFWLVLLFLALLTLMKFILITGLARAFGASTGTALRVALAL